jgi:hypothetical protein
MVDRVCVSCEDSKETGRIELLFEFSLTNSTEAMFIRVEDDSVSELMYTGFDEALGAGMEFGVAEDESVVTGIVLILEIVAGTDWN